MLSKVIFIFAILSPIVLSQDRNQLIEYAIKQYYKVVRTVITGVQYPTQGIPTSPVWEYTSAIDGWTSGFYPGILWNLYYYTNDDHWKQLAIRATDGLFPNQFRTDTHDIGFMIITSYGKGYELTQNSSYPKVIVNAANSLATRFNPIVGCTKSWNGPDSQFLVIVDNMMNLELLFRGYQLSGNKTLYNIAVSHANRTLEEHVRKDYSSYHVVNFNHTTGAVIRRYQFQGYNDLSTWSRGEAWLINGFTMTYRFTKSKHFLEAAENLANYYINHLPDDGIAPWDFNVPRDKYHYIPRDSSSAAITASGLFELYGHTKNERYLKTSKHIMESLSSDKYRADGKAVYKLPALIVNGTLAGPNAAVVRSDLALIYGDYYFINAFKYLN